MTVIGLNLYPRTFLVILHTHLHIKSLNKYDNLFVEIFNFYEEYIGVLTVYDGSILKSWEGRDDTLV